MMRIILAIILLTIISSCNNQFSTSLQDTTSVKDKKAVTNTVSNRSDVSPSPKPLTQNNKEEAICNCIPKDNELDNIIQWILVFLPAFLLLIVFVVLWAAKFNFNFKDAFEITYQP